MEKDNGIRTALYETVDEINTMTVKTKIVEDKHGDRELITTVSFDYTGSPAVMSNVLWTLTHGDRVDVSFSSQQGIMMDVLGKQKESVEASP